MNIQWDYNAVGCDYVKDGVLYVGGQATGNVLVESENDLTGVAQTGRYAPGTLAHTGGYKTVWELAADGTWPVMKSE